MAVAVVRDLCSYLDGEQANVSLRADQCNFLSFEAFSKCKHLTQNFFFVFNGATYVCIIYSIIIIIHSSMTLTTVMTTTTTTTTILVVYSCLGLLLLLLLSMSLLS